MKERKAYKKPTREEYDHRVEMATQLLSRRITKGDIKRLMIARFGVGPRAIDDYLSRAKDILFARLKLSATDQTVSSLAFYESIVVGGDTTIQQKMVAQDKIDWVLGVGPQFSKGSRFGAGNDEEQKVFIVREVVENRSQVQLPLEEIGQG